ncbi:hypothetical protein Hanom_Chr14g01290081 [Helianthus anomalus]
MAEQRSWWDHQDLHREQELACRQAWEQKQVQLRIEQSVREDKRWSALATTQELAVNNAKPFHDQERHQRDYMAGLPYSEHTPWTCYENLPVPRGPSDPYPRWPEGVGSSFIPPQFQQTAEEEKGPLDDYRRCSRASPDTRTTHTHQLILKSATNASGEVCLVLLLLYIIFAIWFYVSSSFNS